MKSIEQISRYAAQCTFPNEDWKKLLEWTKERYGGGRLHRAQSPKCPNTFEGFLKWLDNGIGAGEVVMYGNMMGMVKDSLPDRTTLSCYLGLDNNLIIRDLQVNDPERLKVLSKEEAKPLLDQIYTSGQYYSINQGKMMELYTPERNSYVSFYEPNKNQEGIGVYVESDGCKHHFSGVLVNGRFKCDVWLDLGYAPLRPVDNKDIHNFHASSVKAGWSFNARTGVFTKLTKRGGSNVYWYMNEQFAIVRDFDNGGKKHQARFEAGNYFLDQAEAVSFMGEVHEIRNGRTSQPSHSSSNSKHEKP